MLKLKNKMMMLLFLVVTFVFSFIGSQRATVENYDSYEDDVNSDETKETDEDKPPPCGSDNVPSCYATVQYQDYDQYSNQNNDLDKDYNYILKTQIVPPVCPACPAVLNNHEHAKVEDETEEKKQETEEEKEKTSSSSEINTETNYESNSTSSETNINQEQNYSQQSNETKVSTENSNNNTNTTNYYLENSNNNLSGSTSGYGLSNNVSELRGQIKQLQQKLSSGNGSNGGECPPCPACARCPEPAFTCQKVPNYRSQNIGSYLPIPVVNDFSTF